VFAAAASPAWGQNIDLGTAATFGVLGASTVTNTGLTFVQGDVGVWPGTSITGFPPGTIVPGSGSLHAGDPVAQQAQADLAPAYADAKTRACVTPIGGGVLDGLVLAPGVYCMTAATLAGILTLNGPGVYIFQMTTTLTAASNSSVLLTNGASACSTWWQVGSSATIGTNAAMAGSILAFTSVTMNTGASVNGRVLAEGAAVTLDTNNVSACSGSPVQPDLVTRATPDTTLGGAIGDIATLSGSANATGTITFTLFGPNDAACASPAIFTSTVPVNGDGHYSAGPFTPNAVGVYSWIASYSGDANNNPVLNACNGANESVAVSQAVPDVATTASAAAIVGGTISDTATLTGGANATGSITFSLYGPNNATCTGAPIFTSTVPVAGNGAYGSGNFTTASAGTYRWIANYSGDANNSATANACNAANETVAVAQASPAVATTASAAAIVGGTISDTATLTGGANATGSITFSLYGPNNATCTGAPIFTSTVAVAGNGAYGSGNFTTASAGTYRWIANYSGDANNSATANACNAANETVAVAQASPAVATTASAAAIVGGPISDAALLSSGVGPTGSITFSLYGPNNATCTGAPIFTATAPVAGNGAYGSGNFTTTSAGTYRWIANYSGDANNTATTNVCNAANETVAVAQASPAVATTASAAAIVGGPISDAALLSSGVGPTGSITFNLYGPNNATCTGAPIFTATAPVAGNGAYGSGNFTTASAGTYRWIANYSGDANNVATTNVCNATNETVAVAQASPGVATTASAAAIVGGTISDAALLSGGVSPTGSITFNLYGPNNATCTGAPIFTATAPVAGNGAYGSGNFTTTSVGTYRWIANYSGDANNAATTNACNAANESVTVSPAAPGVATTASATVIVGGPVSDTATLTGGANATGSITFNLYGPNNVTCTGAPIFTATAPVAGNGAYGSGNFTTASAGTYRWIANYSGDANNSATANTCNAANERVTVSQAAPGVATTASAAAIVGGTISDAALLSGGVSPTGSITFSLYGPNNATCTGAPIFTATAPVAGNGAYGSGNFTTASAGTYRWIANYSGDANNSATANACNAANETVAVAQASPAVATTASAAAIVGGPISDAALLSGGVSPTGSITFSLYGPNNATCTGAPIFTSTVPVAGNGAYGSGNFTTASVGTYRWIANYSGDANNKAVTNTCNGANESVAVSQAAPVVATTASAAVIVGGTISDSALLSSGVSSTGTITFNLYGPNNATCTGAPLFTATVPVAGNGTYGSGNFTTTSAGTYRWIANYSGDANNSATANACNAANESVAVSRAAPGVASTASAAVLVGGTISDAATLTGAANATGTITFNLYGPNNATCTGTPTFTATVPVAGNGTYGSGNFTTASAGTYRWIANYSGDANNTATTNACNAANESVTVSQAAVVVATTASAAVLVGGMISDSALLSGGVGPTGSITFNLYGPNNATCAGAPIFTATVPVAGNGAYGSGNFTTASAGTYRWIANYSGDANNAVTANACNAANESVAVSQIAPSVATTASAPVLVGGMISDSALLSGGINPTGSITFNLYGPNNATCTGAPIFTATVRVARDGTYGSGNFTTMSTGTYRWIANYSGDADSAPTTNTCNAANESVIVTASLKTAPISTLSDAMLLLLTLLLGVLALQTLNRRAGGGPRKPNA
jgi:hypothetical protein